MTDRLTPGEVRKNMDFAEWLSQFMTGDVCAVMLRAIAEEREEAARREAEQKPSLFVFCSDCKTRGECWKDARCATEKAARREADPVNVAQSVMGKAIGGERKTPHVDRGPGWTHSDPAETCCLPPELAAVQKAKSGYSEYTKIEFLEEADDLVRRLREMGDTLDADGEISAANWVREAAYQIEAAAIRAMKVGP